MCMCGTSVRDVVNICDCFHMVMFKTYKPNCSNETSSLTLHRPFQPHTCPAHYHFRSPDNSKVNMMYAHSFVYSLMGHRAMCRAARKMQVFP